MSRNKTIVFAKPKEVVIEDREMPSPKNDQLLLKTKCTLISTGTELTILNGEFPAGGIWSQYGKFPFVPGYNNIAEVVDVGPGVDRTWIGRKVATTVAHTQYAAVKVEHAQRSVRPDVPDEQAVFFAIAEIVMNGVRRANVRWGESVAVYGLGLLGQFTVLFCRLAGARPVFAIDTADSRLERLPEDSAIVRVNPGKDDVVSVVQKATRQRMADVVFEVTGDQKLIPEEFKVLRGMGRFVVLSSPRGPTLFDFNDLCNNPSYMIIGTHSGSHPRYETPDNPWTNLRHAEMFFDLIADGDLNVARLISHRESYAEACRLYRMLLEDRSKAMGVVLDWSK
ncbi:MAG: zinc-binding dehydrogenase [Kiritimatiellota bacterium]|nr:zinc-binding dehydrogenase [Kiritimatiellota bacterium]